MFSSVNMMLTFLSHINGQANPDDALNSETIAVVSSSRNRKCYIEATHPKPLHDVHEQRPRCGQWVWATKPATFLV